MPIWKKSGKRKRHKYRVLRTSRKRLDKLKLQMEEAKRQGDWQKMSELQYGQLPKLEEQLKQAAGAQPADAKHKLLRTQVGAEEIAEVVSAGDRYSGI